MLKNTLYFAISVIVFFAVVVLYGFILHIRQIPLEQALKENGLSSMQNARLVLDRKNYELELYEGDILIKKYKAVFGRNNARLKIAADDYATPTGNYIICDIDSNYIYHKYFHLNYPTLKDAAEALKNSYISEEEFKQIKDAELKLNCPYEGTKLGSNIGIHGIGEYNIVFKNLPFVFNWTNGSAALSNEDIDELQNVVSVGTEVTIIN